MMDRAQVTDEALASSAREGSSGAFDALVLRYQRAVYALAWRLVGNHEDADDVAQEAFVQTWQALDRYDPERPFKPWLYRIVTNTALKFLRRARSRREEVLDEMDGLPSSRPLAGSDPPGELASRETLSAIARAMNRLKPEEKILLHLRVDEEMSYTELAEALGIRLGTVMSRLHRARSALRRYLTQEGVELKGGVPLEKRGGLLDPARVSGNPRGGRTR